MLSLRLLPARQGDAIWITWGNSDDRHKILIDLGTEEVGRRIRQEILDMPKADRRFDLLVITHVDQDHIGGVLTCLAEADPIQGLTIGDVWFNGYNHLGVRPTPSALEPMGPAQGERFSTWLRHQNWNAAFSGGPVQRLPNEGPPKHTLHDGLELTVLGPTPSRLRELEPKWRDEVELALAKGNLTTTTPGLQRMGARAKPILEDRGDLQTLADTSTNVDHSEANGSSIALLLEYKGLSVVLSGDAFADDLVDGIDAAKGRDQLHVNAFKLPHHGSEKNVTRKLIERLHCDRWLFSSDGTRFKHPDPVAVARVIAYSATPAPVLCFNVPSKYADWWGSKDWQVKYGYTTEYGGLEDGLVIGLDI